MNEKLQIRSFLKRSYAEPTTFVPCKRSRSLLKSTCYDAFGTRRFGRRAAAGAARAGFDFSRSVKEPPHSIVFCRKPLVGVCVPETPTGPVVFVAAGLVERRKKNLLRGAW